MRKRILFFVLCPVLIFSQMKSDSDVWEPFKFFIGNWEGTGGGQPGKGSGERTYEFILKSQFIQFKNIMSFEPQQENTEGEVHEDFGVFSFDKRRKKYILRQFYSEGYINQFVLDTLFINQKTFVFVTENVENGTPGFRARITLSQIDPNAFSETFELAMPEKDFGVCIINRWKRVVTQ